MGNSLDNSESSLTQEQKIQLKRYKQVINSQTNIRNQSGDGISTPLGQSHIKRKNSLQLGQSPNIEVYKGQKIQKRFLSLTKESQGDSKLKINLSNSKERKGIVVASSQINQSRPQSPIPHRSNSITQFKTANLELNRTSSSIRPRDLPKHYPSQKIIKPASFQQVIVQRMLPPPTIIISPPVFAPPQIKINFTSNKIENREEINKSNINSTQLQSSHVTEYLPLTHENPQKWIQNQPTQQPQRKLKKVVLNRSFVINNPTYHPQNLQQDSSEKNKQNKRKQYSKQSLPVAPSSKLTQNNFVQTKEQIFTDPKLYQYITNNRRALYFKDVESKYAIASHETGEISNNSIQIDKNDKKSVLRQLKDKYSVSNWPSKVTALEQAVDKQVYSKAIIQEGYHFPTITDISQQQKSDNTSFIPVREKTKVNRLQGQALLNYCQPKIDSQVMADLLKLPLKH